MSLEVHNVMELDGQSQRLESLQSLLKSKGFAVTAEQDRRMAGTNLWMVYAKQ